MKHYSEAFKSQLEERTQLKLKALGVNLVPDSLWDNTEIFEDSVKEVLGCGEALLSVGWDYSEDLTSLIVFFEVHFLFSEKEINEQLNKLLIPKGEYAWMSPTVSTVRGKEWVKLTIPFAAPQFNEFKQTFFAVLDSELDRRFKLMNVLFSKSLKDKITISLQK